MRFIDERTLISRLKAGEKSAVTEWYSQSTTALMAFFSSKVLHPADAEELMHDTYLSCIAALPLFRGQSGLWTFMISIAKHELADYWRKRYAKKAIALLPFGGDLLDIVQTSDGDEASDWGSSEILHVLKELPEELAELLQLKYVDGCSVDELAGRYGLTSVAMQSKLYRAKQLFKRHYERISIS